MALTRRDIVKGFASAVPASVALNMLGTRFAFAQAADFANDVEVLNYALTLEYLESDFYTKAAKQVKGLSSYENKLTAELRDNELAHVDALTAKIKDLGGKPAAKPMFAYGKAFASRASYLKLANTLEDTGVSAYNGAAPQIKDKKLLAAAGTIVQIEGRHAALIRFKRGMEIAPNAFDEALERDEVLRAVDPFVV